jgi:signal transduction histidine kinase
MLGSTSNNRDGLKRWLTFALAGLAGLALVVGTEWNAWNQVQRLQREMATVRAESFYLGVHLRAGVWRLDGRLLRFQLSDDSGEREAFRREARELDELIGRLKPHLVTEREKVLLGQTETAFHAYLSEAEPLLERGIRGIRRDTTAQLARELSGKSAALLVQCDGLVAAHYEAWNSVIARADASVAGVMRLMQWSAVLVLGLSGALFMLAYRVFITPLRNRLDAHAVLLQRQEKLASLGALAAGVAHEIRNPLAAIKFRLFSLKESLAAGAADAEDLRVIGDEINRLERIVQDFLRFARPSEPAFARVSAGQLLEGVRELLQGQFARQSVELVVEPADEAWVRADAGQIKQALINLAQNAAESLGQNGRVTLRCRPGLARLAGGPQPVAIFEVVDNGAGIPPEAEARLFDPFFSTKESGTGLGLSIAARIVEMHGGHIQYQTQQSRGTTFSVLLPRWNEHVTPDSTH